MGEHIEDASYWLLQRQHQIHDGETLGLEKLARQINESVVGW